MNSDGHNFGQVSQAKKLNNQIFTEVTFLQAAFLLPEFVILCPTSSFPPELLVRLAGGLILLLNLKQKI
jgi:hypothetical protein